LRRDGTDGAGTKIGFSLGTRPGYHGEAAPWDGQLNRSLLPSLVSGTPHDDIGCRLA